MTEEPKFDLFSGEADKDALWIEAVSGLTNARERMEEMARRIPGRYFVFSSASRAILAKVDTSRSAENVSIQAKAQGAA